MGIYEKALEVKDLVNQLKTNLELETTTPLSEVVTATVGGGSSGGSYAPKYISFYALPRLTDINEDLVNLDTSNMTTFQNMFNQCSYMTSLNVNHFDLTNVTSTSYMFSQCSALTSLDLSNWVNTKVTDTTYMFYYCGALTHLDMRKFDFTKITARGQMFGSSASNSIPDDCEIIVADDTQKEWFTSRFTRLTNVKTVAEL